MQLGMLGEQFAGFLMLHECHEYYFKFILLLDIMSHPRLTASERDHMLYLAGQGLSARQIAPHIPCAPRTVSYTIDRFHRTGTTQQRSTNGRPPLISPAVQDDVIRLLRRNTASTSFNLSGRLRRMGVARASPRTICRFRQQRGFRAVAPHEEIPPLRCQHRTSISLV